jgi:hypothetical protein
MYKEIIILLIAWILTIVMLILFVPKNRIREAIVIFFFKHTITWLVGLTVVQLKLIEYPVREFSYASKASFSFEYFIDPALCVIFNLYYPEGKSPIKQLMYYFYFITPMTVLELVCEKYTNIIKYIHWTWYITFITLMVHAYISRMFYRWFFRVKTNKKSVV